MKSTEISSCQRGVAVVEFALVAAVFFTLLIGIMEMGRVLFYWNTTAEITRLGARTAAVCDIEDVHIKEKMLKFLPMLAKEDITIDYQPNSPTKCSAEDCEWITVSVATKTPIKTFIPFVPLSFTMPAFSTTLPRESMQSSFDGTANPVCQ